MNGVVREHTQEQDRKKFIPLRVSTKPAGDVPKARTCLACRDEFESWGWGKRICPNCTDHPFR